MKNSMTDAELLKYAVEHGMIDTAVVRDKIEMEKREEALKRHPYSIWKGNDGKWHTYLPDKEKGRVQKKRNTKKELTNLVLQYWDEQENNPTVREVFDEWNLRRLELRKISRATYTRNDQIFSRHYNCFGEKRIEAITPDQIVDFLEEQIVKYDLTAKAFSNLKGVTKGFLTRAKKRKLIHFNVKEVFDELDISEVEFRRTVKEDSEEVFNDDETRRIIQYLIENIDLPNAAILLMFVTGIRCGEVVTLKREDFTNVSVKIRRTETRYNGDQGNCEYEVKDFPKTRAGVREIVIPSNYQWIIKYLLTYGGLDYIFFEKDRYHTYKIRRRLYRVCDKLDIPRKSPHKIRKTYGTILLDNNVDKRLILLQMGHTDISCTENHYHRNRRQINQRADIISAIPEFAEGIKNVSKGIS